MNPDNLPVKSDQLSSLTISRLPADINNRLTALESSGLDRRSLSLLALRYGVTHLEQNGTVSVPVPADPAAEK